MGKVSKRLDQQPDGYKYHAPVVAIALRPAIPRDAARLCVVPRRRGVVQDSTFRNLPTVLPPDAVLVMNDTKVLPARIVAHKKSGGRVKILYLGHDRKTFRALADRRLDVGDVLRLNKRVTLTVYMREASVVMFRSSVPMANFLKLLERDGQTPLPPYLRTSPLSESERRRLYQSVFAKKSGSVAAPTASLHFTPQLLSAIKKSGVTIEYVTLHVGMGTFAPVTEDHLQKKKLHEESYEISIATAARLNAAKRAGRPIIAVGTTVARTLESATRRGRLRAGSGSTSLFIRPGYRWKFVGGLITNYHVPRSSLMMLVAAMIGRERLLQLYQRSIRLGYKLYSFGDGMLIV